MVAADVGVGWNILQIHSSAFRIAGNYSSHNLEGYVEGLGGIFEGRAPVQLPSGAQIGLIGLYAYDADPAVEVIVRLPLHWVRIAGRLLALPAGGPPAYQVLALLTSSGSPGYQYTRFALSAPHTVNNNPFGGGGQYAVEVGGNAHTQGALGFRGIDIWWKRQISPAPSTASFVDVPTTHQFFREIEALKEAGITLGCTATQFCPNASLTRAQMAAFLARALGLYWQY